MMTKAKLKLKQGTGLKVTKKFSTKLSGRKVRTLSLDEDLYSAFSDFCEETKISCSRAIDELMESFLDQVKPGWRKNISKGR
jgi:hypothetical protein